MKVYITAGGNKPYYELLCDLYAPFLSRAHLKDDKQWLIWLSEKRKKSICGIISLNKKNFIQIAISPSFGGKHIGKQALLAFREHVAVPRINWTAHRANYPSLKLLASMNGGIQRQPTKKTVNLEGFFRWSGSITKNMESILQAHLPFAKQEFAEWANMTEKHRKEIEPQVYSLESGIKFPS